MSGSTTARGSDEFPIAFREFAASLRPQPVRDARGRAIGYTAGQPDEIWLKMLGVAHGTEKHTSREWNALIDSYRDKPAHPSAMGV